MPDLTYGRKVKPNEFPNGIRCIDCDRVLAPGDRYASRLTGFVGDTPMTELVCLECALAVSHA